MWVLGNNIFSKIHPHPLYLKSSFWYTSNRLQGKMDDVSCLHLALVKYMRATCHVFEWFWYFPFISNIHTLIFTILLRHIFFSLQQYNMCNTVLACWCNASTMMESTYHGKRWLQVLFLCVRFCVGGFIFLFFYLCDFFRKGEIKLTDLVSFLPDIEKSRCIFNARATLLIPQCWYVVLVGQHINDPKIMLKRLQWLTLYWILESMENNK